MKPSIFIALPTYREQMDADTTVSLMDLVHYLVSNGIEYGRAKLDYGDIALSRNFLASWFLHRTKHTHLLFCDNDTAFRPSAFAKMMARKADVVGCVIPQRAKHVLQPNAEGLRPDGTCDRIGTGLMLISRTALETLAPMSGTSQPIKLPHGSHYDGPLHGFFNRDGVTGEDYSFCDRWTAAGGVVHAVTDEQIGHVGRIVLRLPQAAS
jgi:hypothetical protein